MGCSRLWGSTALACFVTLALSAACPDQGGAARTRDPAPVQRAVPVERVAEVEARSRSADPPQIETRFPPAPRVVALGDLHGDLAATRTVLRMVGAVDSDDQWIGGSLVLVQTGDILDRGDDEQAIVDWFERLAQQAKASGGAVHVLNGNHEIMNVLGDFRYVTPGGFSDFSDGSGPIHADPRLASLPPHMRDRAAAFFPGGPYARILAGHNTVVIVGDTVFVHGGLLPDHVEFGIERINDGTRRLMWGTGDPPRDVLEFLMNPESPVWTRRVAQDPGVQTCDEVQRTLQRLSVKRMVVGHTVQIDGISPVCDGLVWRIDVGMAKHYGGRPAGLEITPKGVSVLNGTVARPDEAPAAATAK